MVSIISGNYCTSIGGGNTIIGCENITVVGWRINVTNMQDCFIIGIGPFSVALSKAPRKNDYDPSKNRRRTG